MDGSKAVVEFWLLKLGARCPRAGRRRHHTGGFTLIDILVSLSVIAVLLTLLMPSLGLVRETTRRVVCASNVRQLGLGVAMYAEDFHGDIPPSVFFPAPGQGINRMQQTVTVRVAAAQPFWDGLGLLYSASYLDAPGVYYCPSHAGDYRLQTYAPVWADRECLNAGEVVCNFQYRASGPQGERLTPFGSPSLAIITDGMRTAAEYSHKVGSNVLSLDLHVAWVTNPGLLSILPASEMDALAAQKVGTAWTELDSPVQPGH